MIEVRLSSPMQPPPPPPARPAGTWTRFARGWARSGATGVAVLVIACAPAAARQAQGGVASPAVDSAALARQQWTRAVAAHRDDDLARARASLAAARAAWPEQPRYTYALAALSARLGDTVGTAELLGAYAGMGQGADVSANPDFQAVVDAPAVRSAAALVAANLRPLLQGGTYARLEDSTFFPESVACTRRGERCYVTSVRHGSVVAVGDRAHRSIVIERPAGLAALGVALSLDEKVLWITAAGLPQRHGYEASDSLRAEVVAVDLASGRISRRLTFPDSSVAHVPGTVYVAADGQVYVSDSRQPQLYRVPPSGGTLELFATDPLFRSLQGMAESPDGRVLFVADYSHGLLAVDRSDRTVHRLAAPPGATLLGLDGLARSGRTLIAVQNGSSPARVIQLHLDQTGRGVARLEVLERAPPGGGEPTAGTVTDDAYVYVANSQWNRYDEEGRRRDDGPLEPPLLRRVPLEERVELPTDDERAVLAVAEAMVAAMRSRDTAALRALFVPGARLVGMRQRSGAPEPHVQALTVEQFATFIARDTARGPWIERLWSPEVRIEGTLATVWAEYDFHFGPRFSHCGVDAFHLLKTPGGWLIAGLADTYQVEGCRRRSPPD